MSVNKKEPSSVLIHLEGERDTKSWSNTTADLDYSKRRRLPEAFNLPDHVRVADRCQQPVREVTV